MLRAPERAVARRWSCRGLDAGDDRRSTTATAKFDLDAARCRSRTAGSRGSSSTATDLFDAGHGPSACSATSRVAARRRRRRRREPRLSELPLLTAAERQQLLGEWNDARPPDAALARPSTSCSRRRRGARPDAAGAWSAAGEPAHLRRARRAGQPAGPPPARAGRRARRRWWRVCVERSLELVVGDRSAVLKAGGAYVPLDPALPARAAGLHAGGRAAPRAADRSAALAALPGRRRRRWSRSTATLDGLPAGRAARPPAARRRPTTWPTSSTPPARPGRPKGVAHPAPRRSLNLVRWHSRRVRA